ncbi:MAG: hypothetical protein A2X78_03010 [Gammaproteobacteria bacterium GWE2_37_16]|nr:MAG: hypothetical protein A2X78_03010 [Gammaproteobacteria bacterium GWE2_37_16]
MSRIYAAKTDLKKDKVKEFFKKRSSKIDEVGLLSVTMYQNSELALKRDEYEKQVVLPYLGLSSATRVLDIGCGTGRWGCFLADKVGAYLGVDFCLNYVQAAQSIFNASGYDQRNFFFQLLSVDEINVNNVAISAPFDLIIIAGVMVYLNDENIISLLHKLVEFSHDGTIIYIREPTGIEQRLTLDEFFSEELQENYSAIYRTSLEYEKFFKDILCPIGFELTHSQPLYSVDLCNRQETQQHFFILELKKDRVL